MAERGQPGVEVDGLVPSESTCKNLGSPAGDGEDLKADARSQGSPEFVCT